MSYLTNLTLTSWHKRRIIIQLGPNDVHYTNRRRFNYNRNRSSRSDYNQYRRPANTQKNSTQKHNGSSNAYFSCPNRNYKVSACPHPRYNDRIKKNLNVSRKSKNVTGKSRSYGINIIEILDISTDDIAEIYLTGKLVDGISSNQTPGPSSNPPINTLESDSSQSDEPGIHTQSYYDDTL